MLDIRFVAANAGLIKQDLEKRQDEEKVAWVDEACAKWTDWKERKSDVDSLRKSRNDLTREINELRKAGKDFSKKVQEAKELPARIAEEEKKLVEIEARISYIIARLPNVLHDSVPYGKDDADNVEVRTWGAAKKQEGLKPHGQLLEERGLADFTRSTKISGAGFYFLKGDLVLLEQALIRFALDLLSKKGFTPITTPLLMRREPYEGVTEMSAFEDVMYKIDGDEQYLIATSEHPIAAMHKDEVLEQLPIKLAGISTCFRKEIGSHGVDTRGLFRVHQFTKVEMFVFCTPKDSWKIHEELLRIAEEILQQLELPYRVVNVCTGDIGAVAAKKYDIEAWFPRQKKYREVVSCSNCTAYQSISLGIRFLNATGEKEAVHTLNSTAIATGRIMAALVENFAQQDGSIAVPKALAQYLGKDRI